MIYCVTTMAWINKILKYLKLKYFLIKMRIFTIIFLSEILANAMEGAATTTTAMLARLAKNPRKF